MKYILLVGKMNAGKSETITSVCKNFCIGPLIPVQNGFKI